MSHPSVILHERSGNWSRQLRPRFQGQPIRWAETRSTSSLLQAVGRSIAPILIVEVDDRPQRGLGDLGAAVELNPSTLSMLIDPLGRPELVDLGRELGATLVLSGIVVPPDVESLVHRWLRLAGRRAQAGGWWPAVEPEPELWERPEVFPSP